MEFSVCRTGVKIADTHVTLKSAVFGGNVQLLLFLVVGNSYDTNEFNIRSESAFCVVNTIRLIPRG